MKKSVRAIALLLTFVLLAGFAACTGGDTAITTIETTQEITTRAPENKISVYALNGPTGLSFLRFAESNTSNYNFTRVNAPDEIVPLLTNGEADIAACPLNVAANIYNKTNGAVKMIAISTKGVLSIVSKDASVTSIADLKGKTIQATGKGSTPEFILNYILTENGLDPAKDVTVEYAANHQELATKAISGEAGYEICMLPEPFASKVILANADYTRALDLTSEWGKVSDVELAQGCIVARTEFIEQNPQAVDEFLAKYKESVVFIQANGTSYLFGKGEFDSMEAATETVPRCNMVYIDGEQMAAMAKENLSVLFNADNSSVGGKLPDDGLYYVAQ